MASDWRIIQSELLFQNRWIELYEDKVEVRTGNITHYTWYKSSDVAKSSIYVFINIQLTKC